MDPSLQPPVVPQWKRVLLRPLAAPGVSGMLAELTETSVTVFMLHRFAVPELSIAGHPSDTLRAILLGLKKRGFKALSLHDVFRKLRDGEPIERAVAFTIDDGYFDHGHGARVFAELECPVTIFVVSGFLDGKVWLWWDQIEYLFRHTRRSSLTARVGGREISYTLDSRQARVQWATHLSALCQDASQPDRLACVADLVREADIELPAAPPPEYAPLTWAEARELEKKGVGFAPHTVTHPVLSSTTAEHSAMEISESWARLQAEVQSPVPVFAYPHGRLRDYGDREMAEVERVGLLGGVSGHFEELDPDQYRRPPAICRLPRLGLQNDLLWVLQCVSGVETLKTQLRKVRR